MSRFTCIWIVGLLGSVILMWFLFERGSSTSSLRSPDLNGTASTDVHVNAVESIPESDIQREEIESQAVHELQAELARDSNATSVTFRCGKLLRQVPGQALDFHLYALKPLLTQELQAPYADWRDSVELGRKDGAGPHLLQSTEWQGRFELRGQRVSGSRIELVRKLLDVEPGKLIDAGELSVGGRETLQLGLHVHPDLARLGKLDQEMCMVRVYGPMLADSNRCDYPALRLSVKVGDPMQLSGLQAGRYIVEYSPIQRSISGESYGDKPPAARYSVKLPQESEVQHVVQAGEGFHMHELELVRGADGLSSVTASFEYVVQDLSQDGKIVRRSRAFFHRDKDPLKLSFILKAGNYQFAILPTSPRGSETGLICASEFSVSGPSQTSRAHVQEVRMARFATQDSVGDKVWPLRLSGNVTQLGHVVLAAPIPFSTTYNGDSDDFALKLGVPIDSQLRIDQSRGTASVGADRSIVVTIPPEELERCDLITDEH